jgi:solute carrier family 39 (zinc transporter), member 1/2/3
MIDYGAHQGDPMTLLGLKWLAAGVILGITLLSGLLSVRFTSRYRQQLGIGDALANGVFIGAALFHLIPDAITNFQPIKTDFIYLKVTGLIALSYLAFWSIEKVFMRTKRSTKHQVHIGILAVILSIHALIAGITLGLSGDFSMVSILFVAILAHKSFEAFAFIINIYRQIGRGYQLTMLLILFSLITPGGIILGMSTDLILPTHLNHLLTACFSAIAAGTFLYIGTTHSHHLHHHYQDSHHQYSRFIATVIGVVLMGLVGLIGT